MTHDDATMAQRRGATTWRNDANDVAQRRGATTWYDVVHDVVYMMWYDHVIGGFRGTFSAWNNTT
jgi:hypothetical protein